MVVLRFNPVCEFSTRRLLIDSCRLDRSVVGQDCRDGVGYKNSGGLRVQGIRKESFRRRGNEWWIDGPHGELIAEVDLPSDIKGDSLPLITVVTVVFNGERFIEETINSVLTQRYPNIEYVIIDGGSSDGTLDIIRKYEYAIDYWNSEPDAGIYDAMNKGISAAQGRWINFMNAGDSFYSPDTVLEMFSSAVSSEAIVLYGSVNAQYDGFCKVVYPGSLQDLWLGLQFCHQSTFVVSRYLKHNLFNVNNKITADLEFFYRSYISGCRFDYVDVVVANFRTGGISEGNRIATILSSWRTVKTFRGGIRVDLTYLYIIVTALFSICAKKLLPRWLVRLITLLK